MPSQFVARKNTSRAEHRSSQVEQRSLNLSIYSENAEVKWECCTLGKADILLRNRSADFGSVVVS